jgi:hypothetical protein
MKIVKFTDSQIENLKLLLNRTELKGFEVAEFVGIMNALVTATEDEVG